MSHAPDELGRKIREAQERQKKLFQEEKDGEAADTGMSGRGFRAAADLVAAVFVGAVLGYWIDRWLDTAPWGMIIMFFLGFIAGFVNIYRYNTGQYFQVGFPQENEPENEPKDKEEK